MIEARDNRIKITTGDAVKASGDITLEVTNTDPSVSNMILETNAVLHFNVVRSVHATDSQTLSGFNN